MHLITVIVMRINNLMGLKQSAKLKQMCLVYVTVEPITLINGLKLHRAVNSHALSASLRPGHYFSLSHAKHVKSPA